MTACRALTTSAQPSTNQIMQTESYNDETRLFRQLIRANVNRQAPLPIHLNPQTLLTDPVYAEHLARQVLGHLSAHVGKIHIKTLTVSNPITILETHWIGATSNLAVSLVNCAVSLIAHLEQQFGIKAVTLA